MAEGGKCQSLEESEVPSVASVDKEKSDEELHVLLLPQEGSIATGGDTGTQIEQLQDNIESLSSGEHEHGRLVGTAHSISDPVSDENNRKLLIPECYDELVQHVATFSDHARQEVLNAQQENFQLELEFGRRSFLEDKQKHNEKVYQSFRTHANEQTDGAIYMDENPVQELANSAFHMEKAPEHEPRSQSPNVQKMLDRITESPVTSTRECNLDRFSERQGGCSESVAGIHMQNNEGDHRVSGTNKADSGSNMSCGNSDNCGRGMAALPTSAGCDNLQQQPTDKWMQTRPGPVKRTPQEPSLVESLTCGLRDAVHVPVDSSESGIKKEFLVRHSRDESLLESLRHSNIKDELTSDASLPGASYMESMVNYIEADRITPHAVDDEVASRPDEHNTLSLPLLTRQGERGYAVGGSTQSLTSGTTGPDSTQYSDHLSNISMGNMAHLAAAGNWNGALNGVLSEAESTAARPYAPGNASSTCNLLNPACDQVAVVSEPCRAQSANSRDFMSERSTVTDCNGISAALLALAQCIQEVSVVSGERRIEGEQQREASVRAWNSNRFQGQADFIIELLDPTPSSARALARREAVIRAFTEEMMRGPSSCSEPVEHRCVCLETDGCRACRVHGTIVPETCQQDSAHDKCCKCLQDVFIGTKILPCSHPIHTECLVSMIQNGELICPLCGRAFLGRR